MDDRIDDAMRNLDNIERKQTYSDQNRAQLLTIHAVTGVLTGLLIIAEGAPRAFRELVSPSQFAAVELGAAPILGGLLLAVGVFAGRVALLEAIGISLILVWDLGMVCLFAWSWIQIPDAALYPVSIYMQFFLLMAVHLGTALLYMRSEARGGRG